ncbi:MULTISPECIES: iron ABC transporter substrate-binding protein [unclassified Methanoregula]|uniref:iron ABC transporter substrate-binding protein n=1 Tax=unclassified Methanoregula TaxID=2649730 RepID=UPI0025E29DEE|nr:MULTISPECIES: iron ABC transporter substrate-binding protein [unclassified Methanoregula]
MLIAGCTSQNPGTATPVQQQPSSTAAVPSIPVAGSTLTVTDLTNRTVTVPASPQKIIGVGAGDVRMLVYLQAADRIVGVDKMEKGATNKTALGMGLPSGRDRPYSIAHPELADQAYIGTNAVDDPELILAQKPDIVFATWRTGQQADALQEKTKIPVVALVSGDLGKSKSQFYQSLRLMGKVLGREARAESVIAFIDGTIADLNKRTKDAQKTTAKKVYIGGVSFNGAHGLLSTEPTYPSLKMINGMNVASGAGTGGQVMIDKEQLLAWDPDVIFIDESSYALVAADLKDPVYQSLKAVKNKQVYGLMPYNWYANNYDTVLANAYYMGKILYPDQFSDVDAGKKADEIYSELDGKPVYAEMQALFGGYKPLDIASSQ